MIRRRETFADVHTHMRIRPQAWTAHYRMYLRAQAANGT